MQQSQTTDRLYISLVKHVTWWVSPFSTSQSLILNKLGWGYKYNITALCLVVLTRIIVDVFPIYANVKQLTQSMKLGPIIAQREHIDQTCLQLVCVRSIFLLTCWSVLLSLWNYYKFGPVVQAMLFKYISHLELWRSLCWAKLNHLCNFERRHHEEQFSELILNLDQWFSKRYLMKENVV